MVRVKCVKCGTVDIPVEALRCGLSRFGEEEALTEFTCPSCHTQAMIPIDVERVPGLLRAGAHLMPGCVPLELLEPHSGPAITWDDVLDFHLMLETGDGSPIAA